MCHCYPRSAEQKTQQSTCWGCSSMNGQFKTSSTLHTIQTQPPIMPHYPSYHYLQSNHSWCRKHFARSCSSTSQLQNKTFHGGTGQSCKTTFLVHIYQLLQKTLSQTSTHPFHTYCNQPKLLTQFNHKTLARNSNRPIICHCRNTNITTTFANRSIIKRPFPMLRIVLHKESHAWRPNNSAMRFPYSSAF